jgi:predicted adenylyl cyclase CyaB
MLSEALGVRGEVKKHRTVYHAGQTRIHYDIVDGLGTFLELEVVLRPDQSHEQGRAIAEGIMRSLEIQVDDIFNQAYIDLILEKSRRSKNESREIFGQAVRDA